MRIIFFLSKLREKPSALWRVISLSALPFVVLVAFYLKSSHDRLAENDQDKLLPSPVQMIEAIKMMAFESDERTGEVLLWVDTLASLKRIAIGVGISAVMGLVIGIFCGLFFFFRTLLIPFVTVISIIPPLALLPILFIAFGVDELAKIVLIVVGIAPMVTRDIYNSTIAIPVELLTKALTLGAGPFSISYRIVLPQLMPRLLEAVRISLGSAWLFLIASEAIASESGLGYRIFLVRRYLAMDVIIPYVLWITMLGFLFDFLISRFIAWKYPWYQK